MDQTKNFADPNLDPRLKKALKDCANAKYGDLVKWRDMYENITPGKHITGKELNEVLQFVKKKGPGKAGGSQYQWLHSRTLEKQFETLRFLKHKTRSKSSLEKDKPTTTRTPPTNETETQTTAAKSDLLTAISNTESEYQSDFTQSRFKCLRRPLLKANNPPAQEMTPIPTDKMLDLFCTGSYTTIGDPKQFLAPDTKMFPLLMKSIPRRRNPENHDHEDFDRENSFFALSSATASTFEFFDNFVGWDVDEELSFKKLASFTSDEILEMKGIPRPLVQTTASCDSLRYVDQQITFNENTPSVQEGL